MKSIFWIIGELSRAVWLMSEMFLSNSYNRDVNKTQEGYLCGANFEGDENNLCIVRYRIAGKIKEGSVLTTKFYLAVHFY